MSENEDRGLRVIIVVSLVVVVIASAVLAAGYIASQQPASLAKTLRKKVMADHADYERTAQTAIKGPRMSSSTAASAMRSGSVCPAGSWARLGMKSSPGLRACGRDDEHYDVADNNPIFMVIQDFGL